MNTPSHQDTTDRREQSRQGSEIEGLKVNADHDAAPDVEFGSGWYHEVAIQESKDAVARKH